MEFVTERTAAAVRAICEAQVATSWDLVVHSVDVAVLWSSGPGPAQTCTPWVSLVCGGFELAIWQQTGAVHTVNEHGAVSDDPIWDSGDGEPFRLPARPARLDLRANSEATR